MPKTSYITKRRETWYLRLRIPADLTAAYKGREEIKKSLKTRDYKEAAKRVSIVKAEIEAEFEKIRKQRAAQNDGGDVLSHYTDHELIQLTRKWLSDVRDAQQERRIKDTGMFTEEQARDYAIEAQKEELDARHEVLGMGQAEQHDGLTTASKFLGAEGISYTPNSDSFHRLGHFFTQAIHEFAAKNLRELQGKAYISSGESIAASNTFTPKKPMRIGDLFEEYLEDPARKLGSSTKKNYTVIMRAVDEVIGLEKFAHHVTREQCKDIRNMLVKLPSNAFKKTKAKTLKEAMRIGADDNLPLSADTTVNMHMQKFSAVLEYAAQERYIDRNEAKGLQVKETVKSKLRRLPFDNEQLKKIFNSPLYTGCEDGERGYNKPGLVKPKNARFWVPLISLWTGMRLNEICQLDVTDVAVEDGVHLIFIQCGDTPEDSDDAEKRVKTEAGIRYVPVHPMLEKIGFKQFVEERRKSNQKRLFPELKPGPHGNHGASFSKWFRRFLKNINAKKPKTAFHSFRHLYRDALREAELPLDAALQLGGWSRSQTDADYGIGLKPQTLYKHICKIHYPALDLSHLYS